MLLVPVVILFFLVQQMATHFRCEYELTLYRRLTETKKHLKCHLCGVRKLLNNCCYDDDDDTVPKPMSFTRKCAQTGKNRPKFLFSTHPMNRYNAIFWNALALAPNQCSLFFVNLPLLRLDLMRWCTDAQWIELNFFVRDLFSNRAPINNWTDLIIYQEAKCSGLWMWIFAKKNMCTWTVWQESATGTNRTACRTSEWNKR